MRNVFLSSRLAILAAVFLVLGATVACNDFDDPEDAEVVVLVTGVATAGTSIAAPEDATATLTLSIEDRSGKASSFFNNVTFTNFTVTYAVNPPPGGAGVVGTTFCEVGSTCDLTLTVIVAADKAGAGAGFHFASIQVEGHDVNGNPVAFTADVPVQLVP